MSQQQAAPLPQMKGLQLETGPTSIFLQVKNYGGICEVSNKAIEGWERVVVHDPKKNTDVDKWIRKYRGVEALVVNIATYDTGQKYDTRYMGIKLTLNAGGTACVLDLPYGGSPANRFMKCAPNIDFRKPVEFRAWQDADGGVAFLIKQGDTTVPQKWTRESPGDLPEPVERRTGWDYTAQEDWLIDYLEKNIIQQVNAIGHPAGAAPQPRVTQVTAPPPQGAGLQQGGPEDADEGKDGAPRGSGRGGGRGGGGRRGGQSRQPSGDGGGDIEDDEIPF